MITHKTVEKKRNQKIGVKMMKTDIEIAQEAELKPITEVAELLDMTMDDLELYGKYKAKISDEYLKKIEKNEDGKLILVTAINPTPAGEGKTTTSVGLGQAFGRLGKKAVIEAIHAGLECGFWDGKMENVDIISMGPDMMDVHTVKERVSKQSIDNVWKLLKEIVEAY